MTSTSRIVLLESHAVELRRLVSDIPEKEGAAFVLCGEARGGETLKLTSHAVVAIDPNDFLERHGDSLSIQSRALSRITKLAKYEGLSIVFAHSHPHGPPHFSRQDDFEERKLIPFFQARVPNRLHGTLVLSPEGIGGRVYGSIQHNARVVIIGKHFTMYGNRRGVAVPRFHDRQVRAFGVEVQAALAATHVAVVGLGGTGSPVAEQLLRLGVGHLTLVDGDVLDETNVNRVFGSTISDAGRSKVAIAKDHLDRIGYQTVIETVDAPITRETVARRLTEADVIFGCTDKQIPRAILGQIALKYHLPVIDLGVLIDSEDMRIRSVHGRVTTLQPGEACLYCRGRISAEQMRIESLSSTDRQRQILDGYAPELETPAPAVVAFTAAVASFGVMELLHRITGFMGEERASSEVLLAFDQSRVRTNRVGSREGCQCADASIWGRGDESPFLGMTWPTEPT